MTQAHGKNQFDRFLEGPDLGKKEKEKDEKKEESIHILSLYFFHKGAHLYFMTHVVF